MTLAQLIEQLQAIQEEVGDDCDPEVKMAHQPSWPLQMDLGQVVLVNENEADPEEQEEFEYSLEDMDPDERAEAWRVWNEEHGGEPKWQVYIGESAYGGNGYLSGQAAVALGYR